MKRLAIAVSIALAGCAITPDQAQRMSDYELCEIAWAPLATPERKGSAWQHLRQRGEDCNRFAGALQSSHNTNNALLGAGVGMMGVQQQIRANEINAYNAARPRTCNWQQVGSTVQQVCF